MLRPILPRVWLLRGKTASRPASPPTIRLLPFTPNAVGLVKIPPLAYQSMEILGIPPFNQSSGLAEPDTRK